MMTRKDLMIYLLDLLEKLADKTSRVLLDLSIKADALSWYLRHNITLKTSPEKANPTLIQWANRIIEFVESDRVVYAFNRFEQLVRAGIAPDHAFHMVTS